MYNVNCSRYAVDCNEKKFATIVHVIDQYGCSGCKISELARQDIEKLLDTKVNLKLWVKVKEGWQDNDSIVKKFKNE